MNYIKATICGMNKINNETLNIDLKMMNQEPPLNQVIDEIVTLDGTKITGPFYLTKNKEEGYRLYSKLNSVNVDDLVIIHQGLQLFPSEKTFYEVNEYVQKVLMLVEDECALSVSTAVLSLLSNEKIEIEIYSKVVDLEWKGFVERNFSLEVKMLDDALIATILSNQYIGTHLFFGGTWHETERYKKLARSIGYQNDEVQIASFGTSRRHVFCVKCFQIIDTIEDANERVVSCSGCNTLLDVSGRYSALQDAFLGFIHGGIRKG